MARLIEVLLQAQSCPIWSVPNQNGNPQSRTSSGLTNCKVETDGVFSEASAPSQHIYSKSITWNDFPSCQNQGGNLDLLIQSSWIHKAWNVKSAFHGQERIHRTPCALRSRASPLPLDLVCERTFHWFPRRQKQVTGDQTPTSPPVHNSTLVLQDSKLTSKLQ